MATDKLAGKSSDSVKKATGKTWDEWIKLLDSVNAKSMPHKAIAQLLFDRGFIESRWWCQSVTVGYEEAIGRRVFGKREEGDFSVSIGKSFNGSVDDALDAWQGLVKRKREFKKVNVVGDFRITKPNNEWRYWKADLSNGAKLSVNIGPKNDKQSSFSVTLDKLKDQKTVEEWRKYWKKFLEQI